MKKKIPAILFSSLVGSVFSSMAVASVTFSDTTFNLSDYSISKYQTNGGDVTVSQTSSGNPGTALQIETHFPRTFESKIQAAQYMINTNFRYDPGVHGAINSIDASEDFQGVIFQNGASVPFNPVGGAKGGAVILIRQDGHFYTNVSGIAGPPGVGSDNFHTAVATGLRRRISGS